VARHIDALRRLTEEAAPAAAATLPPRVHDKTSYAGRVWITRPRPGVDRMASAWLIRRFIDPQARFAFATDSADLGDRQVPFDMYGAAFGHHGARCTLETLQHVFDLTDPAVSRIAAIVHDLDLKDGRFGAPETTTVAALIDGLQARYADDDALLVQGMNVFEALHTAFANSNKTTARRSPARRADAKKPRR
jgi:hypothetical protein